MATASRTEIFNAPIENVYKVLIDYESYPEFMDGVTKTEVLEKKGSKAKVKYHLSIIKKFSYVLDLAAKKNESISWTFDSGDLFKTNIGSWTLKDLGDGKTEVTYALEIDFKVMVPGMISKKLISSNLPSMMKEVEKRAKGL